MTNETIKTLLGRRSCRSYKKEVPSDEILGEVLECGTYAPSAMGRQSPWIVLVKDRKLRDEISKLNAAVMGKDDDPFYGAPVVAIVFASSESRNDLADASLVMGNLMNAAYSLGLGSCWINRAYEVFKSERGKEILKSFNLPDGVVGVGNCIFGYPDGPCKEAPERKSGYIRQC